MHTSARRWTRWLGGAAVAALVSLQACTDETTRPDPTVAFAPGAGGGGPSVDAADPDTATQDTTLDVQVIGSGFDDGSTVTLLLAGQSTPKIVTNSTQFVDRNTLIANITIAADADTALYDIAVTTSRGKKGQGSELFAVKTKGSTEPGYTVDVTVLGTIEGVEWMAAQAITTGSGGTHIVGTSSAGLWHMMLGGSPTLLPCAGDDTLRCDGGGNGARPVDVNDAGLVVGARRRQVPDSSIGRPRAVFWETPVAANLDLPIPFAHITSEANGVNAVGQLAGSAIIDRWSGETHALLWSVAADGSVSVRDLHEETFHVYGTSSKAYLVNDRTQVAGHAGGGAFFWDAGSVVWLPGEGLTWPSAITSGDPVMVSGALQNLDPATTPYGETGRGVVWTIQDGVVAGVEDLPPHPRVGRAWAAWDINDAGDVAGWGNDQSSSHHALLWTRSSPGGPYDVVIDLGLGSASAVDDLALADGVTRVVGSTTALVGKGKNARSITSAVMWTIRKIN